MQLFLAFAIGGACFAQSGHWEGHIKMPRRELPVVVDLAKTDSGSWIGSISLIGSTTANVPLSDIVVEGRGVRFKSSLPEPVSLAAAISEDGKTMSGAVTNAAGDAPIELARTGEPKVAVPPPSSPLPKEFAGTWEGTLNIQGRTVRVAVILTADPSGIAKGKLVNLDQGDLEIPASTVTINGKRLEFESRAISGTYKGTLAEDGEISGEWAEGAVRAPLVLKKK